MFHCFALSFFTWGHFGEKSFEKQTGLSWVSVSDAFLRNIHILVERSRNAEKYRPDVCW